MLAERRNTSRNGWSANAAESGFGWWARLAARSQSPEPQYSGANHSTPLAAKTPSTSSRRRGSTHASHSP